MTSALSVAVAAAAVVVSFAWASVGRQAAGRRSIRPLLILGALGIGIAAGVGPVNPLAGQGLVVFSVVAMAGGLADRLRRASSWADIAIAGAASALAITMTDAALPVGPAIVAAGLVVVVIAVAVAPLRPGGGDRVIAVGVTLTSLGSAGAAGIFEFGHDSAVALQLSGLVVLGAASRAVRLSRRADRLAGVASALVVPVALSAYGPVSAVSTGGMLVLAAGLLARAKRSAAEPADAAAHDTADAGAPADPGHSSDAVDRTELFHALIADSSDMVTLIDSNGIVEYQNTMAHRMLSSDGSSLVGRAIEGFVHPEDRAVLLGLLDPTRLLETQGVSIELQFLRSDGRYIRTETTVNNHVANDKVRALALTSRDIGDRKRLEDQLVVRAFHDALTGLGNRALYRERLEHAVAWARRYGTGIAVMFLDLDGFKLVNDTLGHDVGDRLLVEVANRLAENLRTTDTVARMGGDEFAILLEDPRDVSAAPAVAARILASLQTPIFVDPFPLKISCSIGLDTTGGKLASSAEDLLRNADLAMYRAKALGKNQVARYEPNMREEALLRVRLEKELRRAIDHDELVLHYQPVGSIASGEITGVEALVRWQHPERGMIPPGEFVPVAEESGLIVELGRWALAKACQEMGEVSRETGRDFWVSVNVATRQLLQPGLVQSVRGALNRSGLSPDRLVLEITEGALLDDPKACASLLHQLRALGVRLAIDDFGTGYSSLSRLRSFAVDKLKIDRSFIQEIVNANDHAPIVAAVMAMAHSLGLTAVAEGVETADQLACLHRHGCEEVQGYLLARPLPVEDLVKMLARNGDLLAAVGVPPRAAVAESSLSTLVREAATAGGSRPEVVKLLLSELSRQLGVGAAYVAKVDLKRNVEEILMVSRGGAIDLPAGLCVPADRPGAFRTIVGSEVPPALADRGVASLTIVPMVSDDPFSKLVLAVAGTSPSALPSQHVVLMELLTRLLGNDGSIVADDRQLAAVG